MIPVLYDVNETYFTTNGLGGLPDAVSCIVTEERNGEYELEMEYPITGLHFNDITIERIIYAVPADGKAAQPFVIYEISAPISGVVTIKAEHISYRLNKMVAEPFTATSASGAMSALASAIMGTHGFTFWTDKATTANMALLAPTEVRAVLGGTDGSILDIYKGEYEFDMFAVMLHASRGSDKGVTLRYGKNITGIEAETSIDECYTGVVPYWEDSDGNVVYGSVVTSNASLYAVQKTIVLDLSSDFDDQPTAAELETRAAAYLAANEPWVPDENIEIDFVPLRNTSEYASVAPLERVNLCDTVHVIYEPLGISKAAKVIKTVYNVLKDQYDKIQIGSVQRSNLSQVLHANNESLEKQLNAQALWNNETLNMVRAKYGSCDTIASTNAKVVTLADFELYTGAEVAVLFTHGSTASDTTVNVNGTGAKQVYFNGAVASSTNKFLIGANAVVTFRYNGTYWIPIGYPRSYYGTCTTAAATAMKESDISDLVLCKGTVVMITMTNDNTAATPTLNLSGTGAQSISGNSTLTWLPGETVQFSFDGAGWFMGDTSLRNHFWHDSDGAHVADTSTQKNILIDSDSVDIRDGTNTLASFGANNVTFRGNAQMLYDAANANFWLAAFANSETKSIALWKGVDSSSGHKNASVHVSEDTSGSTRVKMGADRLELDFDNLYYTSSGYMREMDFVESFGSTTDGGIMPTKIDSGEVHWYKWHSGKLEIWGWSRAAMNADISVASWAGGYESSEMFTLWGAWPVSFVGRYPTVSYRMCAGDTNYIGDYWTIDTCRDPGVGAVQLDSMLYTPWFKFWRGTTAVFGHPQFSFHAVGRWK